MRKAQLIGELNKRFLLLDGRLIMKQAESTAPVKKRITPAFVGQLPTEAKIPFGSKSAHSRATQRALEAAHNLEKYYQGYERDEYPEYSFRT